MRLFYLFATVVISNTCAYGQVTSIASFTPMSGPVGTTITIQGNGFDNGTATNAVYMGAVKAEILTVTTTQLTVKVPVGASGPDQTG